MTDFIRVDGLQELDRKLSKMDQKTGFKTLRSAMMAASRPTFLAAKANALAVGIRGKDSGATAAAMSRWTRKIKDSRTVLFIGPKNRHKKALAIYNEANGTDIKRLRHFHLTEFGSVHGPAQPYMRPAFASTWQQVARSFAGELRKAINKVARNA